MGVEGNAFASGQLRSYMVLIRLIHHVAHAGWLLRIAAAESSRHAVCGDGNGKPR